MFWGVIENNKPDLLVISQYNGYEKVEWHDVLNKLNYVNNIVIIGPSPLYSGFFKYNLDDIKKPFNYEYIQSTDSVMIDLVSNYKNVKYISAYNEACSEKGCELFINNSFSMLADGSHFTRSYSKYFVNKVIRKRINKLL